MKNVLALVIFASFLVSCNVNPSKEARIQKLESEISTVTSQIKKIENRVKLLETENEELKTKINTLE